MSNDATRAAEGRRRNHKWWKTFRRHYIRFVQGHPDDFPNRRQRLLRVAADAYREYRHAPT